MILSLCGDVDEDAVACFLCAALQLAYQGPCRHHRCRCQNLQHQRHGDDDREDRRSSQCHW